MVAIEGSAYAGRYSRPDFESAPATSSRHRARSGVANSPASESSSGASGDPDVDGPAVMRRIVERSGPTGSLRWLTPPDSSGRNRFRIPPGGVTHQDRA